MPQSTSRVGTALATLYGGPRRSTWESHSLILCIYHEVKKWGVLYIAESLFVSSQYDQIANHNCQKIPYAKGRFTVSFQCTSPPKLRKGCVLNSRAVFLSDGTHVSISLANDKKSSLSDSSIDGIVSSSFRLGISSSCRKFPEVKHQPNEHV